MSSGVNLALPKADASTDLALLPQLMFESVACLPSGVRLILFTRHSLRVLADSNGFASYDLPLTDDGRRLATAWGSWLAAQLPYDFAQNSLSSPIQRCIDTAVLMQLAAGKREAVSPHALLVEPGSLVVDASQAGAVFRQVGALQFINQFLQGTIAGTKPTYQGGLDLLRLFFEQQPLAGELLLVVSHDTLLAALLAILLDKSCLEWADWPDMMEGAFLWFEGEVFADAVVNVVWRGQRYQRAIMDLLSKV